VLKEEDSMNIDEKMLEKADAKRGILQKVFQHASRGCEANEANEANEAKEAEEDPTN